MAYFDNFKARIVIYKINKVNKIFIDNFVFCVSD